AEKEALRLLDVVGLAEKAKAYPAQLSGGQQQRVAIARALATKPQVLLCDEATSALDPTTTGQILELIQKINAEMGITVIIITHQMSVVESICKHVAILDNGEVAEQGEVAEIFSHPKTEAAKKLVYPEGVSETPFVKDFEGKILRVIFNGAEATGAPMIATMAVEKGIIASIVYASTKTIGGKTYGSMLLSVPDNAETVASAIAFLTATENVLVQEVEHRV
ncbi:MAG: ATP-binding cassette domain-containing protein, partial [Clostridia bacterium]|nr:ATP-binding cassette domain-containing protein [Clostridia bacterium]